MGWLACVLGAGFGYPWVGPVVVVMLTISHLMWVNFPRQQLVLVAGAALLGWIVDTLMGIAGALSFSGNPFPSWVSPPWMIALWVNFALTLPVSLKWLLGRYSLGVVLGAMAGPLAYWSGARLEALEFRGALGTTLLILALLWAASLPLLLFLAQRIRHDATC